MPVLNSFKCFILQQLIYKNLRVAWDKLSPDEIGMPPQKRKLPSDSCNPPAKRQSVAGSTAASPSVSVSPVISNSCIDSFLHLDETSLFIHLYFLFVDFFISLLIHTFVD